MTPSWGFAQWNSSRRSLRRTVGAGFSRSRAPKAPICRECRFAARDRLKAGAYNRQSPSVNVEEIEDCFQIRLKNVIVLAAGYFDVAKINSSPLQLGDHRP